MILLMQTFGTLSVWSALSVVILAFKHAQHQKVVERRPLGDIFKKEKSVLVEKIKIINIFFLYFKCCVFQSISYDIYSYDSFALSDCFSPQLMTRMKRLANN